MGFDGRKCSFTCRRETEPVKRTFETVKPQLTPETIQIQCNVLVSNYFHSVKDFLFLSAKPRDFDGIDFRCQCTKRKLHSISDVLTLLNLKIFFFTFSVKDRYKMYQLSYFICIKDYNAQTITSLKLNLCYFFIYCCQHHKRKTTCLGIFLLSDRQWCTEHQYFHSRFPAVSILQLLIIYRIYDYDLLTLSQ